jgi:glycosyltransferase involved in cell wall biosynthesis
MPSISIALATYNGAKYLSAQLDSLYKQTRLPDEVVVTDDCSTDSTLDILIEYNKRYGLKYFINKTALGVNKNFEKAISFCSGDYIAICDQDDIWLPSKIETSFLRLQEIEKNGLPSLVSSTNIHINGSGNKIADHRREKDSFSYTDSLWGNRHQGCSLMMNRKLVEKVTPFPQNIRMYDAYIGLTAAMIGNKYDIGEPLMLYRLHSNNVMGGNGSQSFFAKLNRLRYRYAGFFHPQRLKLLLKIEEQHSRDFLPERLRLFNLLKSLHLSNSIFRKLVLLFKIRELSILKKLYISVIIIFSKFYK